MDRVTSELLEAKKEQILCEWEERSISEVTSAESGATLALRNSLPLYLQHLSEALATNLRMDFKSVNQRDREGVRLGKLHGADRANNRSYSLTEVIFEYHILRDVIFKVMEEEKPLDKVSRDIILDSLEQAVNDAAVEFTEIHTDIQQKFVNTLTHDLKNPLTVAKVAAQVISKSQDPHRIDSAAKHILNSVSRLETMIHDLLDTSRVRAGEPLELKYETCDLKSLLLEVQTEMSTVYPGRIQLDAEESVEGCYGRDGIRRAVENLVTNAIKYGTQGAPVDIRLKQLDAHIEIAVHNVGNEISKDNIPYLFEHYKRSKNMQAGDKEGWGLGLTLVKGVVNAHHGHIRVESSKEKGTVFTIELPVQMDA